METEELDSVRISAAGASAVPPSIGAEACGHARTFGPLSARKDSPLRTMFKNTSWNILGSVVPLAVAAVAIPALIRGLGVERFGLLTLAWTLIGYLSLFDFGLGRALTKLVAEKLGSGEEDEIPSCFWDSLALLLFVGILGSAFIFVISRMGAERWLHVSAALRPEVVRTALYIALAIPLVTLCAGLRGFLEAHQEFRSVNIVRMSIGIFGFLGPMAAIPFTHRLDILVAILLLARLLMCAAYFWQCLSIAPGISHFSLGNTPLRPLLHFGGWMTVSNLLTPMMVSMDRFMIGGLISAAAVAYYVTPSEMMLRVLVLPTALQNTLFPMFSSSLQREPAYAAQLYRRGNEAVYATIFPIAAFAIAFAPELLRLWLGQEFSRHSAFVLQVLAFGVLINAVAHVPSIVLQAAGRPDLNAKLQMLEAPLYLPFSWFLIARFGIRGAAIAWTARVFVDTLLLLVIVRKWFPAPPLSNKEIFLGLGSLIVLTLLTTFHVSMALRIGFAAVVIGASMKLGYRRMREILAS